MGNAQAAHLARPRMAAPPRCGALGRADSRRSSQGPQGVWRLNLGHSVLQTAVRTQWLPSGNLSHGLLENEQIIGGFPIARKLRSERIFHCHVGLPEGKQMKNMMCCQ